MPKNRCRSLRRRKARRFRRARHLRRAVATAAVVAVGGALMPPVIRGDGMWGLHCASAAQLSGAVDLIYDVGSTVPGVSFNGIAQGDDSGYSVSSAGDVNGDGVADVLVGAPRADPNGSSSGQAFLIYGQGTSASLQGTIELSDVGTSVPGVRLNGISAFDFAGRSVSSAGDINGDGFDDVLISADWSDLDDPQSSAYAGQAYLIYGQPADAPLSGTIELSTVGSTVGGVRFNGIDANDYAGRSVSAAGDVNGDGLGDLIIGASSANASGQSYLIYGQDVGTQLSGTLDLSSVGTSVSGVRFNGIAAYDNTGVSVASAGDVNGDGLGDLLIGANGASPNGDYSGQAFLIYGQDAGAPLSGTIELSDLGTTVAGARFNGIAADDFAGVSIASAGDVNGDGLDDLLIGAYGASPNGVRSGQAYLIYGQDENNPLSGTIGLSAVGSTVAGTRFNGVAEFYDTGVSVSSAGDVNDDGLVDLLIGAYGASPNGTSSGQVYLIYGQDAGAPLSGTIELSAIGSTVAGAQLNGSFLDTAGISVSSAGDVNGDGVDDMLIGANAAGTPIGIGSGQAYLIYGFPEPTTLGLLSVGALPLLRRRIR